MRISDWSSDVCSSDLLAHVETADEVGGHADAAEQRENMLQNPVVEHALAGNRPFFLCVEGGRVVLEILDQRPGLGAFIQDLGFAFIDLAAARHPLTLSSEGSCVGKGLCRTVRFRWETSYYK